MKGNGMEDNVMDEEHFGTLMDRNSLVNGKMVNKWVMVLKNGLYIFYFNFRMVLNMKATMSLI